MADFVRDSDNECVLFEEGKASLLADCLTDGHYLCEGCCHNRHRLNDVLGESPDYSKRGLKVYTVEKTND